MAPMYEGKPSSLLGLGVPAAPGRLRAGCTRRGAGRGAAPPHPPETGGPGRPAPGGGRWVKSVPVPRRTMRRPELALRLPCAALRRGSGSRLPAPAPGTGRSAPLPPSESCPLRWARGAPGRARGCGRPLSAGGPECPNLVPAGAVVPIVGLLFETYIYVCVCVCARRADLNPLAVRFPCPAPGSVT